MKEEAREGDEVQPVPGSRSQSLARVAGICICGIINVMLVNPILDSNTFGMEVVLDLYDCNPETICSKEKLQEYARELCQVIEMTPCGAPFAERFGLNEAKTAGYSIVQLIETSSITGHFSEEWNSAYINIFSCKEFDPEQAAEFSKNFFEADRVESTLHIRK